MMRNVARLRARPALKAFDGGSFAARTSPATGGAPAPRPPERDNNFDVLRLFAALLVIYGHAYALTGAAAPAFAGNGVHTIGVKIFFSISGYLVAASWLRDPDLLRYLIRRAVRIFPALAIVVLASAFVLGPLMTTLPLRSYFADPSTAFYLKNIVLYISYHLPGVFMTNPWPVAVNGSLWSLPAEFSMYLLLPATLGGVGLPRLRPVAFAAGTLVFCCVAVYFVRIAEPRAPIVVYATNVWSWLEVAPYFLIGAVYAVGRLERFLNLPVAFIGLFALAVFETGPAVKEALLYMALPYGCLAFALERSRALKVFVRAGDLSYGLFLYSFPVEQILAAFFGARGGPWKTFLTATLLSAILAYASWHLVEKRALQWKPGQR